MNVFDYIVVGSGPSGTQAAQTLAEAGKNVLMLDAGIAPAKEIPDFDGNFTSVRKTVSDQYPLWLGENFEALTASEKKEGPQLTPPRQFVSLLADEVTPVISDTFFPMESLARGGFGSAWGLGCCAFSDEELIRCGLPVGEMNKAYQVVAGRIGISYTSDDIEKYTVKKLTGLLPAVEIDEMAKVILKKYVGKKSGFNKKGIFLGKPALALLTKDKDGRKATAYNNMDYYTNSGYCAWRPDVTLEYLKKLSLFTYRNNILVKSFREETGLITVNAGHLSEKALVSFHCKKLILACNVMGTARITARSFNNFEYRFPVLCNPNTYIPCFQQKTVRENFRKTSLAQLMLFHDPGGKNADVATASLFTYSSLMLFRLMNNLPFNYKDSRRLLQWLAPHLVIAGVYHPDELSSEKFIRLNPDNTLAAQYRLSRKEVENILKRNKEFAKTLRQLGCWPLKKIIRKHGSSHHYAGTLPFLKEEKLFHLLPDGRLSGTKNVFVADGSGFCYLPAKGITFTLMANAHRTALNALTHD